MNTPVKISERMNKNNEFRSIRIPKECRKMFEITLGDSITIRDKDNKVLSLWVEKAYEEDRKTDQYSTYVTSEVYEKITNPLSQNCNIEVVSGITLGCDPELVVIDRNTGNLISAQYFLNLNKGGSVGYDGLLLELRPSPSTDESIVTNNLSNLLSSARTALNLCETFPNIMLAGISSFFGKSAVAMSPGKNIPITNLNTHITAGFHLHYGLPNEILGFQKQFVARQIVKALDFYVGFPAIIPEGNTDSYRRSVQGIPYGKPGSFRIDNRTFEYRTPGAALMKHPILTQGILGLGAVVIEDVISRIKNITSDFLNLNEIANDADIKILYPNIPPAMEIFRTICSPTTDHAKKYLDIIRNDIEKMVGFAQRADTINNFFNHIETDFTIDVEQNWWGYKDYGQRQSG